MAVAGGVSLLLNANSFTMADSMGIISPKNICSALDESAMMAVFFNKSTSADESLDAVAEIRKIAGEQCFVSGMTAIVEDIKELKKLKSLGELVKNREPKVQQ